MALASFRTLNAPGPTVSISFVASAAIPDFVRPARVPGFRFGLGLDVFFIGILMMATKTLGGTRGTAIDDPSRIRRSRDIGAYLGLVPRRYQSGEVDYTGGISKCGDRRVRTPLYEAANVMLTRYKGQLKLKDWAFAIAKRSTMRKARVALARRLTIIMHAMLRDGTEFASA
jgi:transposase